MTEAQAKASLERARRKALRFARLRNFWRIEVRRRLARLRRVKVNRPHIVGNYVEGGSYTERIAYLFKTAPRVFRLYYEEFLPYADFRWAVHNVPRNQWRSDCSSWAQDVLRCVGATGRRATDILAAGGAFYTGWVVENCQQVDRHYAEHHIGTAVIYGWGGGFHMGLSLGSGQGTIEHGTASLDYGTFDEFGAGTSVRYFAFLT